VVVSARCICDFASVFLVLYACCKRYGHALARQGVAWCGVSGRDVWNVRGSVYVCVMAFVFSMC